MKYTIKVIFTITENSTSAAAQAIEEWLNIAINNLELPNKGSVHIVKIKSED